MSSEGMGAGLACFVLLLQRQWHYKARTYRINDACHCKGRRLGDSGDDTWSGQVSWRNRECTGWEQWSGICCRYRTSRSELHRGILCKPCGLELIRNTELPICNTSTCGRSVGNAVGNRIQGCRYCGQSTFSCRKSCLYCRARPRPGHA